MSTSFRSASQNSSVSTDDRMETGSQVVKSPPVTVTQSYGIMLPPVTVMQQQQQQRISTSQAAYGENRVSYSPFAPADQQLSNFPEAHVRIVKDEKGGTHQVLTRTLIDPGQASGLSPAQFQKFQSAAFASQEGLNSVKRERGEIDEKGMSPMSIVSYQDSSQPSPSSSSQPRTQGLRYQASGNPGDAMLSAINYNDTDMLHDGGFDVSMTTNLSNLEEGLLGNMASGANVRLTENPTTGTFDLFDGDGNVAEPYSMESLSPQAFHDNNPGFPIAEGGGLGTVGDSDHSAGLVPEGRLSAGRIEV